MTVYRITWKPGQAQSGYFHEVDAPSAVDAAWYVATTLAPPADGQHDPAVLVDAAEIDPQSGKPVRPEAAP